MIVSTISREPLQDVLRHRGISACDLLEALPAAIYLTDAAGHLTFYNQAAAELWGWCPPRGEAQWCGSWRLYWPDGTPLPHEQCPMAVAIQQNRQVRGVWALAERPDSTRVPFAPYPTPLRDPAGELIGAINMLTHIREYRDGDARWHEGTATRLPTKEAERRANNLLISVLPIATMIREDDACHRRPPKGQAQALALLLLEESCLGPSLPLGLRAPSGRA